MTLPLKKPIHVIHLPTTVGGNPQGLSSHLNKTGLTSETWTFKSSYYQYAVDRVISLPQDNLLVSELKRFVALSYVFRSDVVFFNFGQTLFQQFPPVDASEHSVLRRLLMYIYRRYSRLMQAIELGLLRLQNKVLFVQYQGDDARQGAFLRDNYRISLASQVPYGYYTPESDNLKRQQISLITGLCSKVYALNPDLLHVLPAGTEFLPYSHISLKEWSPSYTQMANRPLRIAHAPSHRGVKGTTLILDALDVLSSQGLSFELVLVEGLSNAEAKDIYESVDILVDQLFAGWYGGVAVEAMSLGKPVVSYIRHEDLRFIPAEMQAELPIVCATPDNIQEVLRTLVQMPRSELLDLAMRSRRYVERWHDPELIAHRIHDDIKTALLTR